MNCQAMVCIQGLGSDHCWETFHSGQPF
jgi:hypothetical protein